MSARIIGRTGKASGVDQAVSDLLTLGSGTESEVRIESRAVSRRHAQIVRRGTEYFIEDLDSRNGTFLNGRQVKRFRIAHLDVISMGPDVDLIFLESGAAVPPVPRPQPVRAAVAWVDGPLAGQQQEIPPDEGLLLGRKDGLHGLSAISRRHAILTVRGDRLTVEDLGSANGTWVNGTPITAVTQLTEGDEVSLGGFVALRLKILGGTPAPSIPTFTEAGVTILMPRPAPGGGQQPLEMPAYWRPAPSDPVPSDVEPKAAPPAQAQPPVAPLVRAPAADASGNQTVVAPRGPAVAPPHAADRRPPDERPAPPAGQPERSVLAPPRMNELGPPAGKESLTMQPPREAASGVPGSISDRARAARQGVNATVGAQSGPSQETPPPAEPAVAPRQDGGSIVGVTLEGPTRVTLNLGTFRIGRQTDADVVVDSLDIGRRHALLHVEAGGVSVEALPTANGTFVDGVAVKTKAVVANGARLRFATVEFIVVYEHNGREHP